IGVSEPREKKRGLFGRLFGGREAEPETVVDEKPAAESMPEAPSQAKQAPAEAPASFATVAVEAPPVAPLAPVVPQPVPTIAPASEPAPRVGWFQRLKSGLSKTSSRLSEGINSIFNKRKLDSAT